jgi:hypothetical protein
MDTLLSILGGILCKVYDDLNDMKLLSSDRLNEILKGSQWIILTLLSIYDFNFSILLYFIHYVNFIMIPSEWSNPYESSLLYIFPILILLSFQTRTYYSALDSLVFLGLVTLFAIEPLLIAEEISYRKLFFRVGCSCLGLLVILFSSHYKVSSSIIKIMWYLVGYSTTSLFFQGYELSDFYAEL